MQSLLLTSSGYRSRRARIVAATPLTAQEMLFELALPDGARLGHEPGQFVAASLFGVGEAPLSVCSSPTRTPTFELCVRRAGRVTEALHRLQVGDEVGIRGPFGVGFPLLPLTGSDLLLVAGGLGIAPLRGLIHYILDDRRAFGQVTILFGCQAPSAMLFSHELEAWRRRVDINFSCSVDRADPDWAGPVGVISSLIPGVSLDPQRTCAVACGPPVMYRPVVDALLEKGVASERIFLSLERRMRCGLGKCGHCQIEHLFCCQDGPVFRYDKIATVRGAL